MYTKIYQKLVFVTRPVRHGITQRFSEILKNVKLTLGYNFTQWQRIVMYREIFDFVKSIHPSDLDALEISPGSEWQKLGFKSFSELKYPEFDICFDTHENTYDIIIADQVFEHLLWPYRAGKNVFSMLKVGGYFIVTTPFLIRVHDCPVDCSRWTETGLKYLLAECGFDLNEISTGSWGNRDCVKANLPPNQWSDFGWFRSLKNENDYPIAVWAIARKK